jgi:NADPH-dependent curcumin reductase
MNLKAGQKIVITKRLPKWPNPIRECFATQEFVLPKLEEGQVLIRVHYVSIDPVFRVWVSGAKSYIDKT